jgi:hypothetical protein
LAQAATNNPKGRPPNQRLQPHAHLMAAWGWTIGPFSFAAYKFFGVCGISYETALNILEGRGVQSSTSLAFVGLLAAILGVPASQCALGRPDLPECDRDLVLGTLDRLDATFPLWRQQLYLRRRRKELLGTAPIAAPFDYVAEDNDLPEPAVRPADLDVSIPLKPCENRRSKRNSERSSRSLVVKALEGEMFTPAALEHVVRFTETTNGQAADQRTALERELRDVTRRIDNMVKAIEVGGDAATLVKQLKALEARQTAGAGGHSTRYRRASDVHATRRWSRLRLQGADTLRSAVHWLLRSGRCRPTGSGRCGSQPHFQRERHA